MNLLPLVMTALVTAETMGIDLERAPARARVMVDTRGWREA